MVFRFWKAWQLCPLVNGASLVVWSLSERNTLKFPIENCDSLVTLFLLVFPRPICQAILAAATWYCSINEHARRKFFNVLKMIGTSHWIARKHPTNLMHVAELWIVGNIFFVIIGDGKHDQHMNGDESPWILWQEQLELLPNIDFKETWLEENETQQHRAIIRSWDPSPNAIVVVKTFLGFQFSPGKIRSVLGGWLTWGIFGQGERGDAKC